MGSESRVPIRAKTESRSARRGGVVHELESVRWATKLSFFLSQSLRRRLWLLVNIYNTEVVQNNDSEGLLVVRMDTRHAMGHMKKR